MRLLLVVVLWSGAAGANDGFTPFAWHDRVIRTTDDLVDVVYRIDGPDDADSLRAACSCRNGSCEYLWRVVAARLSSEQMREQFFRNFRLEHPVYGPWGEALRLPFELQVTLGILIGAGLPVEDVVMIRKATQNLPVEQITRFARGVARFAGSHLRLDDVRNILRAARAPCAGDLAVPGEKPDDGRADNHRDL